MKNTHIIVNAKTNEQITNLKVTTSNFRDICREYLMRPENFGERLFVVRNRTNEDPGTIIFDVTNIRYSSGQVRMTLYAEYERQQKLHAQTLAKREAREKMKNKTK